MDVHPLFPLENDVERLTRHAKLPLHTGSARVGCQDMYASDEVFGRFARLLEKTNNLPELSDVCFDASLLAPATGDILIFLQGDGGARLTRDFGSHLVIVGETDEGSFRFDCPRFYVKKTKYNRDTRQMWAIATPVNETATLSYGNPRSIARVSAVINNFDFELGNFPANGTGHILRIEADGHSVGFEHREDYASLKTLLDIGTVRAASLVTFSFDAWEGASESDLEAFARDVAELCSIVARQHTGLPIIAFLDDQGQPVKRLLGNPVESSYRYGYILDDLHRVGSLPLLFRQCFTEFCRLRRSIEWRTLPSFYTSAEDSPYLEQKCASVFSGLELLLRNSLVENGVCTAVEAESMNIKRLINAANTVLRWNIPSHYDRECVRLLRNAVSHGGSLTDDPEEIRKLLDKWSLFTMRRFLMRLGYDGTIISPFNGYASSSPVDDFSEACNTF